MQPKTFIAQIAPGAQQAMRTRGILASLSIAQAALESGWGAHAPGNNLFGIKANGWRGATQILRTSEYIGGRTVYINDVFRAYTNWAQSVEDHAAFLTQNPRYRNIIGVSDYRAVCERIKADGYATEPSYPAELIGIIEKYGLATYDKLPPLIHLDVVSVVKGSLYIAGWALNASGLARVDLYRDGWNGLASTRELIARTDVQKAENPFGWYKGIAACGFRISIPDGKVPRGNHVLAVYAIGRDGSKQAATATITMP